MGEEYGETAPFPYFISHTDPELVAAVRRGRQEEFAAFQQEGEPPDPQDETTFASARLNHSLARQGQHQTLRDLYRQLARLRREVPALAHLSVQQLEVIGYEKPPLLFLRRWHGDSEVGAVFHFGPEAAAVSLPLPPGPWRRIIDSAAEQWRGPGSLSPPDLVSEGTAALTLTGQSFILLERSAPP
jgi:maltooligosyltrehalose trehalohydrolase